MNKNYTIAKNTIYLYIRMLILMLVSLYSTRVLLKALGFDDYGIFNVVGGLIVMITFINQGLSGASRRFIMAELTNGDIFSQRTMFTSVLVSHLIMCGVFFILGETIGLWLLYNYLNIPDSRFFVSLYVYQLTLVSALFNVLMSPFNSLIISEERMSAFAIFSIVDALLKLIIVWILVVLPGDKLITYSCLLLFVSLIDIFMYYYYCRINFPLCRLVKINRTSRQIKNLFGYMGWSVYGLGAHVVSRQGSSMLVNIFYNVGVNAAIGVSNMIIRAASQFIGSFQMAFSPQLTKNYIAGNYIDLNVLVNRVSRYSSLLVLTMLIPISIVISDLLIVWLGDFPDYTEQFCVLTFICIYLEALSNPLIVVITADKDIKYYQLSIASIYVCDFLISWFVLALGAIPYSIIIIRILLAAVGLAIRLLFMRYRVSGFSIINWIRSVLGSGAFIVLLSTPLLLLKLFKLSNWELWPRFVFMGGISLFWVLLIIWFLGITVDERSFIRKRAFCYFRR